jgi:hypothetical protein
MLQFKLKFLIIAALPIVLTSLAASPASAQIHVVSLNLPSVIPDPNAGFNITYSLVGSQFGSRTIQVNFYLSTTSNGRNGTAAFLSSTTVGLQGGVFGPFGDSGGSHTVFISPFSLTPNGRALLQSIATACQPQSLFLLADIDGGIFSGFAPATTMGTTKLPDFAFTGGTSSSSVITPGGTTSISFDLFTRCPASSASRVGIFLTDTSFNPLAFIGAVSIAPGAGTSSLPPTPITFSPTIPLGNYNILLIADVDGIVAESDENNNGGAFALTVRSAALSSVAKTAEQLKQAVPLREDMATELEDLEFDPPEDYVSKF